MIIWFWHQIVPSSSCCDKFSISMVFHIFHIFSKNCIIHQLKKIFFKISFLLFFLGLCASQYTILVNHYEFYEIFLYIEHQLPQKILRHFLRCIFLWNPHQIEKYLFLFIYFILSIYLLEARTALLIHTNYSQPNIEDTTILCFYHIFSCICY